MVNQLHRSLGEASFLNERDKLALTEAMAEADFRLVEGGASPCNLML